ncbi:alpha-L-arabinofuranosidase C-terminal domain-containing protein [Bifidobacterium sp. ESL0732]|uniref:arabinosylfuranosidase ArfA n=1 Tax=Bifidobacterium sp. ESL0732 TaxID=2983222 RepID=UPI0023F8ACBE|nr:alpha-L-arabinofuranosidase C-terminal domain-containing protein [Bifidobacterium sp. ESL0732]WEV64188.1 alpha-L-arabinofuranosidase [Bifidobacterium sp. ESL0732]
MPEGATTNKARLVVDDEFEIAPIDDRLFGSFAEHLGRCIYTGIYEPGHPTADADGFRQDVIDLVRELGATTIRYPGGNFVSGYRWEDGVGPKDQRPRRLDTAWHSTETNQFGLHEMVKWLGKVNGNELMEAVNLGTRGLGNAMDLLEYANVPSGTKLSEERRANGADKPFDIRMWCLGNEMDGPWQLGHITAEEYGRLAAKVAAGMRQIDPNLELVVCGSSTHDMQTYGSWEETVLDATYDLVDFVSCHAYARPWNGDMQSFVASGADMEAFIHEIAAIVQSVKARHKTSHQVYLSFDEWNVWYKANDPANNPSGIGNWPTAPRLLEQIYSVTDAAVVGDLLISLMRNADTVHSASMAQLVNVIAPIMTEPGGPAWRQTIFYPFSLSARFAKGGTALQTVLNGPSIDTAAYGEVSAIGHTAVRCKDGSFAIFLVNRSLEENTKLEIALPAHRRFSKAKSWTLHDDDVSACNTLEHPNRVTPQVTGNIAIDGDTISVNLAPVSWTLIHVC